MPVAAEGGCRDTSCCRKGAAASDETSDDSIVATVARVDDAWTPLYVRYYQAGLSDRWGTPRQRHHLRRTHRP